MGRKEEIEIEELLEKLMWLLYALSFQHDFEMGVVGSQYVEDVWKVGSVAYEFQNGNKLLFVKAVNIVDGDDDRVLDFLQFGLDVVMKLLEGFVFELSGNEGIERLCFHWGNLLGLKDEQVEILLNVVLDTSHAKSVGKQSEQFANDRTLGIAQPRTVIDEVILVGVGGQELCLHYFKERGLAVAIGFVDVDDQ